MCNVRRWTYILSVLSPNDFTFDQVCSSATAYALPPTLTQLRIDVSSTSLLPDIKSHIFGTILLSSSAVSLPYPIALIPHGKNNYFKPHASFSLLGMFQNPMMMMMLLTGVMVLGLPYVMVRPVSVHCVRFLGCAEMPV